MAGEHGDEEASDHDERPYRPSYERLLLFVVFRLGRWFFLRGRDIHSQQADRIKIGLMSVAYQIIEGLCAQERMESTSSWLTSLLPFISLGPGVPGSDTPSLASDILGLRP